MAEDQELDDLHQVDLLTREGARGFTRADRQRELRQLQALWAEIQQLFGRTTWVALALLCVVASVARAQGLTNGAAPQMIWNTPPMLGMWSPDSARVEDTLAMVASTDWPPQADTALAELRTCSRLLGAVDGWQLRTVASAFFQMRVRPPGAQRWEEATFVAFAFPGVKRIYVVQRMLWVRRLLKHELLHALLAAHGFDPSHGTPVADQMFRQCFPT